MLAYEKQDGMKPKSADGSSAADSEKQQVSTNVYDGNGESWTADEERAAVRKVDFIVMPILMLVFFSLQLDRANM